MWAAVALLGILTLLALDPALAARVEKTIEGFGNAVTSGPAGAATKWWIIGSVVGTALGITSWLIIDSLAAKRGEKVAPPAIGTIGAATGPPSVHGETSIEAGGVKVGGGVGRSRSKRVTVLGGL